MKRLLSLVFFAVLLSVSAADASGGPKNRTFGLGLQLGSPTGITGKVFFNDFAALTFGVGFAWPFGGFGTWIDGNFHFYKIRNKREDILTMRLYAGPGLQLAFAGSWYYTSWYRDPRYGPYYGAAYYGATYVGGPGSLAVRGPFGFTIHWTKVAFDTFVEVGPVVYLVFTAPVAVFVAPTVSVGARYYF